jgi:hypothetical protein
MTSEIPRDIEMIAFKIADGWSHNDEERADMQADIQRALLAERDRCAKVAEETGKAYCRDHFVMMGPSGIARKVASAIRQQASP